MVKSRGIVEERGRFGRPNAHGEYVCPSADDYRGSWLTEQRSGKGYWSWKVMDVAAWW